MKFKAQLTLLVVLSMLSYSAEAASLPGSTMGLGWALPFVGILLSIACLPLFLPRFWHHHQEKIAYAWALAFILPATLILGGELTLHTLIQVLLEEYLPFVILVGALFVVTGGIVIRGNLHGSPRTNVLLLLTGTLLASVMGTTGASVLMIRPILRANDNRRHNTHVIIFYIFLVANAGGMLTPLGDPPLFLGFLQGVDFFWTLKNCLIPTLSFWGSLLAIFYLIDRHFFVKNNEERPVQLDPTPDAPIRVLGAVNLGLLAAIVVAVLFSGIWKSGIVVEFFGASISLQDLLRDGFLLLVIWVSLKLTPPAAHQENSFSWAPLREVAVLFVGIFIAMAPVLAMLKAGNAGAFSGLVHAAFDSTGQPVNAAFFWMTGGLSAFLDNAPTYLVFFNLAGGDANHLMAQLPNTLAAISMGAVFFGAGSYIGNAPNFMVKAIAAEQGVAMPGFFGYMKWSLGILLPLFLLMTWIFF